MNGLGLLYEGWNIPDDLVEAALDQGGVIVSYTAVVESGVPVSELSGPSTMPSSTDPGFMVLSQQIARDHNIPILYDPLLGQRDEGAGTQRVIKSATLLAAGVGVLAVAAYFILR